MMSFLRSVIVMKPSSSISAMSPVRSHPSVAEDLARRLLVLVVAGEDRLAADQQLAVVGEPAPRSRGAAGRPCRSLKRVGPVDRAGGRALGQPVALEDEDVERVEELDDLARERRAARDRDAQPPAEPLLHLRVDEPVGEAVPEREPPRDGLARLPQRR